MKAFYLFAYIGLSACNFASSEIEITPIQYDLIDTTETIESPSGREIEFRSLKPKNCETCPFVFFSHGANSTYNRHDALFLPFAARGFHIVAPNHTDSEAHKTRDQYELADSLGYRLEDYDLIMDRYKPDQHFVAGHSYGAMIAQMTAGAKLTPPLDTQTPTSKYSPEKIIAISPPGPIPNYMEQAGWSKVTATSLIVTGTNDIVPTMTENWKDHLVSFSVAPEGSIAVIYEDMDHYMNGAYGRENQNASLERNQAMGHLINVMADFLTDSDKVLDQDTDFAEIRRR